MEQAYLQVSSDSRHRRGMIAARTMQKCGACWHRSAFPASVWLPEETLLSHDLAGMSCLMRVPQWGSLSARNADQRHRVRACDSAATCTVA